MSGEQPSLWLVAGDCEFDIKPGQNAPNMQHLLGNWYELSTDFNPWNIWIKEKKDEICDLVEHI